MKRYFLIVMLAGLGLSAIIGIYVFIAGSFKETEIRLLLTTVDIGLFSLMGLCAAIWFDRRELLPLAYTSLVVSAIALVIGILTIWEVFEASDETMLKLFGTSAISATALAYVSLIFLLRGDSNVVRNTIYFATGCLSVIWFMLVGLIIFEWDVEESYFRMLGVFSILTITATIAAPILKKILAMQR